MKRIKLFFFLFLIFSFVSQHGISQKVKKGTNYPKNSMYKILKIDSIQNIYTIYAKKKELTFKIASKKETCVNCSKIIIGKFYNFKLYSLFPPKANQKISISGIRYFGTIIPLEGENVIWDLFETGNLIGLCYKK